MQDEHPRERDNVIKRGRVMGRLQPTRTFGMFLVVLMYLQFDTPTDRWEYIVGDAPLYKWSAEEYAESVPLESPVLPRNYR